MLFAGTAVANGSCRGVVNAIGMGTEVGAIQQQIADAAAEEEDTPLKKKLDIFGERLAQVSPACPTFSGISKGCRALWGPSCAVLTWQEFGLPAWPACTDKPGMARVMEPTLQDAMLALLLAWTALAAHPASQGRV